MGASINVNKAKHPRMQLKVIKKREVMLIGTPEAILPYFHFSSTTNSAPQKCQAFRGILLLGQIPHM